MTDIFVANLLTYSTQLAVLALAAMCAEWIAPQLSPSHAVRQWHVVVSVGAALPLLQPWYNGIVGTMDATLGLVTVSTGPTLASWSLPSWQALATLVIAGGVAMRTSWLLLGLWRLRALVARAARPTQLPAAMAGALGVARGQTDIRVSDEIHGPVTVGLRRPVVLLPPRVLELPDAVQRAIICHECLHVQRHDWLRTLAEEAWCALMWFHPAARLLVTRAALAREILIDHEAIVHTGNRRAYAQALLAFAQHSPRPIVAATPLIRPHHLSRRIARIAQEVPMTRRSASVALIVAAGLISTVTVAAVASLPMSIRAGVEPGAALAAQEVVMPGPGVDLPRVVHEQRPEYTAEALQARIQGTVLLNIVVETDGRVGTVTVAQSLDAVYGLDDSAVAAARLWTFEPGRKNGRPAAIQVALEMRFTLRK